MKKQSARKDALRFKQPKSNKTRKPSKLERFLMTLLSCHKEGLRGLECSNENGIHSVFLGEHVRFWSSCLNSDVSNLQNTFGIRVARVLDPYHSVEGHTANFKRYWLADIESVFGAIKLLNICRVKRGLKGLSGSQIRTVLSGFL